MDSSANGQVDFQAPPTHAREARYQSIVDTQTELICRYDAQFRLTFVNRAYCAWQGRTAPQLLGQNILEMTPPGDLPRVLAHVGTLSTENLSAVSIHASQLQMAPSGSSNGRIRPSWIQPGRCWNTRAWGATSRSGSSTSNN
ncbi:MAG: PAS domain S-box protein [Anaerolineae bacterium]|nr:PAS domain S-box protein [Anaerolineae bacterium]